MSPTPSLWHTRLLWCHVCIVLGLCSPPLASGHLSSCSPGGPTAFLVPCSFLEGQQQFPHCGGSAWLGAELAPSPAEQLPVGPLPSLGCPSGSCSQGPGLGSQGSTQLCSLHPGSGEGVAAGAWCPPQITTLASPIWYAWIEKMQQTLCFTVDSQQPGPATLLKLPQLALNKQALVSLSSPTQQSWLVC